MTFKEEINNNKQLAIYLFIGIGIGIWLAALQAIIHYITNQDAVEWLGMAAIDFVCGAVIIGMFAFMRSKLESESRSELLRVPDKVSK